MLLIDSNYCLFDYWSKILKELILHVQNSQNPVVFFSSFCHLQGKKLKKKQLFDGNIGNYTFSLLYFSCTLICPFCYSMQKIFHRTITRRNPSHVPWSVYSGTVPHHTKKGKTSIASKTDYQWGASGSSTSAWISS